MLLCVGAVRCVRTINSVKVFVEAYVSCNDAYSCAIPCAIVEVVCKYFESLRIRSVCACLLEFHLL